MGSKSSKEKPHDCYKTCLGKKKQISQKLKCIWYPSKPYHWEYTNDHQNALHSLLEKISQDVIDIIESYIKDLKKLFINKRDNDYYKYCRSNTYHETDIYNKSVLKVCDKHYESYTEAAQGRNYPDFFKILLLGSGGVGKTSLASRTCGQGYPWEYDPVIEDSYRRMIGINKEQQEKGVLFDMIDTFGLRDQWIRECKAIWFCFDVMRKETFECVIDEFKRYSERDKRYDDGIFPLRKAIIFVGCKVDLKFDNSESYYGKGKSEEIYLWEIKKGIKEIGDYPYVETSAKVGGYYGTNIEYLMRMSFYESWIQTKLNQGGSDK